MALTYEPAKTAAPRGLNLAKVAVTVTAVVDALRLVQGDERVIEIIRKGKQIGQQILSTANESAQNLAEMIELALEVYESLRGPTRALGVLKQLDTIDSRAELVYYIKALASEPDAPDTI